MAEIQTQLSAYLPLLAPTFGAVFVLLLFAFSLGYALRGTNGSAGAGLQRAERRRLEEAAERHRMIAEDLRERLEEAQKDTAQLERSLLELPEIAQRLSATRDLREIPRAALDLVEEIFVPRYCIFYRTGQAGLVAVDVRGDSPVPMGHRVREREGIVGWAALRQMAVNSFEVGTVEAEQPTLEMPEFSLCLPVVNGQETLGVILIGPTARELPRGREIGRTIALITAVTTAHTLVLREQEILAKTDGLTGLLNRSHLLKQLEWLMTQRNVYSSISLFLFDVDHFKHYNDTNGHLAGDELLKRLAMILKTSVRDGELAGRYGGEEFLIVMPNVASEDALQAADRLRERIAAEVFPNEQAQPLGDVTISGGVATWPADGETIAQVLHHADQGLYAAKHRGRNKVLVNDGPAEEPA